MNAAMEAAVDAGASVEEIEAVFRARHSEFVRVAAALVGTIQGGEEAVQDGLARALARRWSFRRAGTVEAWLWRVIVNAARNARRRVKTPEELIERSAETESTAHVRAAVAALPERQRLVLFLRYYADLDYRTIAAALRIRPGTVSATLTHAHANLRASLEEETP
jgi:RNA polymerase sigma factor (sigma-70 family)